MFEEDIAYTQEVLDAIEFYRDAVKDVSSSAPGSTGMEIRVEIMESDYALRRAIQYIAVDQLWESQINMYGEKTPRYKPSTIRKKAKLGQSPDKLVNYTEAWSYNFMNQGIYVWVDATADEYRFENTLALPYFAYIPDEMIGMTQDNFEMYEQEMKEYVEEEQRRRLRMMVEGSQYADIINALLFVGYDF